ncbi:pre-mRNA-splicing factor 38B-like isoform X2 [Xenia sp. Carnegie-2017]|uniref:pre-mRNA-splicing factor 38B-like isoform X2 n=1 Tax=Xenia sp. Carnegie-2017 TaxID=2897299 RepID=UPI001F03859D|nr:pre-mRNA-splicing factor 38B-like isoform X2 [Xenia sp. Carnegie-2017]XP_046845882.1 pre-mRNA-splicing factor 38B-like isoform X2 [Xenia sp. Carnegie-2017]XP_046845883.1 pre-mRNA-splicing factor 38B-like isoform X2 [Xenia sp. Carnegie-2017]
MEFCTVDHLEPWERGSRKTSGQVGMCGGVRGVGAGGIISSAFCLLYKLFTLRLTRKQLNGLINHNDSPYIRGLGFMYIRYSQPPADLWEWYEPFLEDEEEIDPKAGGGCTITIGQMVRSFLLKLDWYDSLFPRIPVPIQKEINGKLQERNLCDDRKRKADEGFGEAERYSKMMRDKESDQTQGETKRSERSRSSSRDRKRHRSRERSPRRRSTERRRRSRSREPKQSRERNGRERRSHSRERHRDSHRRRDGSQDRESSRSKSRRDRS